MSQPVFDSLYRPTFEAFYMDAHYPDPAATYEHANILGEGPNVSHKRSVGAWVVAVCIGAVSAAILWGLWRLA